MSTRPSSEAASAGAEPLLDVDGVVKAFRIKSKQTVSAVDRVSFTVLPGTTLGVVGESGCGKSTLARLVLGVIRPDSGTVTFDGVSVGDRSKRARLARGRSMQVVFQDPSSALNPRATVGESLAFSMKVHGMSRHKIAERLPELLVQVGMHGGHLSYYPHQLSGGQKQRVNIARALALEPKLVVCDEAVSAVDPSVQAQIINLLTGVQREGSLAYLFISHDLGVVHHLSDQVLVMYLGHAVEYGPVAEVFGTPLHPYTEALLLAGSLAGAEAGDADVSADEPPNPLAPPSGCRYRVRCPHAVEQCAVEEPEVVQVREERWVKCHRYVAGSAELRF